MDREQDLQSRIGALRLALDACLDRLIARSGDAARHEIETLRDGLMASFKSSGIPPEREMDHADVVRPAIEVLETMFDAALARLPKKTG